MDSKLVNSLVTVSTCFDMCPLVLHAIVRGPIIAGGADNCNEGIGKAAGLIKMMNVPKTP